MIHYVEAYELPRGLRSSFSSAAETPGILGNRKKSEKKCGREGGKEKRYADRGKDNERVR